MSKGTPLRVPGPFVYARLSHNPDGTRTGVQRQIDDAFAKAAEEGIPAEDVRVFAEDDHSAFSSEPRPQFERMLGEIAADRPERGVWFWKLDRGFRRADDYQRYLTIVNDADVHWRSLVDKLDTRYGEREMTEQMMGHFLVFQAGRESKNTSVRQKRKQRELAEQGRHSGGGTRPFGLTADWKKTVPKEARAIRTEAPRLLAGATVGSVCRRWNGLGVETPGGAPKWTPTVVRKLFTSYRLAGARELDGKPNVTGAIPAILDLETIERLRATLLHGPPRPDAHAYLLSGLCYCGECGHVLHAKPWYNRGRRLVKFWCPKSLADKGCGRVSVTYTPLERAVVGAILQAIETPELVAAANADETDYGAVREEIAGVRTRLAELAVARYSTVPPMSDYEYTAARQALLARESELTAVLAKTPLRDVTAIVGEDPIAYWNRADEDSRRALLTLLVERVTVGRAIKTGCRFNEERIAIAFRY